jgi:hypothetical protein
MDRATTDPLAGLAATGVVGDGARTAETLLVLFAGLGPTHGMPRFEFLRAAAALPVQRLYLRDHAQAWYQRGVAGLGEDIRSTADALAARIEAARPRRVVMAGNSAGGYAALLFGHLLQADAVLAFSPRSFRGWRQRLRHRDLRRWREFVTLSRAGGVDAAFEDLVAVFGDTPGFGHADVHYATGDRIDVLHAERLGPLPGVVLHPHPVGGHALVRSLRADDRLTALLRAACTGRLVRRA